MDGDTRNEDGAHEVLAEDDRDQRRHPGQSDEGDPDSVQWSEHTPRIRRRRGIVNRRSIAAIVVLVAGCAAVPVGHSDPPNVVTITTTTTTGSTTTTTTGSATTTTNPGRPLGLITATGVPVAISVVLPEGFLVHSPCGVLVRVSGGEPLYRTPVVLDPGHGGDRDVGAQGRNGLPEKVANLRVAFAAQAQLEQRGIPTVLTRTADYATTIPMRSNLADTLEAEVLVSIHHNAPTPGPSPKPGTEIFMQSNSPESRRLGGVLYTHVVRSLSAFSEVEWSAAPDAGVITVHNQRGTDTYGMLRIPKTPSVLLEVGYMSNPSEANLFATEEYTEVAGRAIADAIESYLTTDEPGTGWYEPGRQFTAAPGLTGPACVDPPLE